MEDTSIRIVSWQPEFAGAFRALNMAWLEELFVVEQVDRDVLDDPATAIMATGGEVFFALVGGQPVGTGAVHHMPDGRWELTKMAVEPGHRGRGIGEAVARAAIAHVRQRGGELYLYTNSKLQNAIRLYRRLGFVELPLPADNPYSRGDVYMELPG